MVGFPDQAEARAQQRVFRTIPGSSTRIRPARGLHRKHFLIAELLDAQLRCAHSRAALRRADDRCEGYVESASIGLIAGLYAAADARSTSLAPRPATTALGIAARPHTGGHTKTIDAGPTLVPTDEHQFRLFPPLASPPTRIRRQRLRGQRKDRCRNRRSAPVALSI